MMHRKHVVHSLSVCHLVLNSLSEDALDVAYHVEHYCEMENGEECVISLWPHEVLQGDKNMMLVVNDSHGMTRNMNSKTLAREGVLKSRVVVEVTIDADNVRIASDEQDKSFTELEMWIRLLVDAPFTVQPELEVTLAPSTDNHHPGPTHTAISLEGKCILQNRLNACFSDVFVFWPAPWCAHTSYVHENDDEQYYSSGSLGKSRKRTEYQDSPLGDLPEHVWTNEPSVHADQFPLHDNNPLILIGLLPEECANLPTLTLPVQFDLNNVTIHRKATVLFRFLSRKQVRTYKRFPCVSFIHSKNLHALPQTVNVHCSPHIRTHAFDVISFHKDELSNALEGSSSKRFPENVSVRVMSGNRSLIVFPPNSNALWVGKNTSTLYLKLYPLKSITCTRESSSLKFDENQKKITERINYKIMNHGARDTHILINDEVGWRWKDFKITQNWDCHSNCSTNSRFLNTAVDVPITLQKCVCAGFDVEYDLNCSRTGAGTTTTEATQPDGDDGDISNRELVVTNRSGNAQQGGTDELGRSTSFFGRWF